MVQLLFIAVVIAGIMHYICTPYNLIKCDKKCMYWMATASYYIYGV